MEAGNGFNGSGIFMTFCNVPSSTEVTEVFPLTLVRAGSGLKHAGVKRKDIAPLLTE